MVGNKNPLPAPYHFWETPNGGQQRYPPYKTILYDFKNEAVAVAQRSRAVGMRSYRFAIRCLR